MSIITLQGSEIHTSGELPPVGSQAPDFSLVNAKLQNVGLKDFSGRKKLLNVFPSLDTDVCALSTRKFNDAAKKDGNTVFIMISADLPFAMSRFCGVEKTDQVVTLSMMRSRNFAKDYGVLIEDGPLAGITARAVIVIDENDKIIHTELVPEITQEPDYESAILALN